MPIVKHSLRRDVVVKASHFAAIRFKNWRGEMTGLYHYVAPQRVFDELMTAESIGGYFNANIKPFPDKYPFTKIESAPAPSAE